MVLLQLVALTAPLHGFFLSVIALVIIDNITALYAIYKQAGSFHAFYEQWTSSRAFDTVKKMVWYSVFGVGLFIIGNGIGEGETMKKVALGLVGYVEGKSLIENIDKILGTNFWELISATIKDKFLPKNPQ